MHNDNTMRAAVEAVAIPNSSLTVGSSHALQAIGQTTGGLQIELCFGFPVGHIADRLKQNIAAALAEAGCTQNVQTNIRSEITARKVQPGVRTISGVKNIIAVASGKGGVGKSTTAANLAVALHNMGARVGILDADLYGPSQPTMLGVPERKPQQENKHFIPVRSAEGIQVMSIGFLVDTDQAVVWRGPMVSQALQQLLFQSE